jgi:protein-L-isoaspartate(D-aspartate) O-methyltransferase
MAWRSHGISNADLVEQLWKNGVITSNSVRTAMLAVDRADFVLPSMKSRAYVDAPLPIGHGATISAPHMHAQCLETMLQYVPMTKKNMKMLDVGHGTGILAAYVAQLVGPNSRVYGIEHIPALVEFSKDNMNKNLSGLLQSGKVVLKTGDGFSGLPEYGPYDIINVGAAAPAVPPALVNQLAPNGVMIIPVGKHMQTLIAVTKDKDGMVTETPLLGVAFVPLTTVEHQESQIY